MTGKRRILRNRIISCVLKSERQITKINSSSLRWRKVTSCTASTKAKISAFKKKGSVQCTICKQRKRESHRAFKSTPSPSSLFRCLSTSRILFTSTASQKKKKEFRHLIRLSPFIERVRQGATTLALHQLLFMSDPVMKSNTDTH